MFILRSKEVAANSAMVIDYGIKILKRKNIVISKFSCRAIHKSLLTKHLYFYFLGFVVR